MRKSIALLAIGLALGWFGHQIAQEHGITTKTITNVIVPQPTGVAVSDYVAVVIYDGSRFDPPVVTARRGNWLTITNKSENLMWLESEAKWLTTPRGYGLGEQLRVSPSVTGEFMVKNKLNLGAQLLVKVVGG